jgi:ribosomal protein S18 acetylase RimI-like enzyme
MENGRAAGYGFFVLEQEKALLGGLHVSRSRPDPRLPEHLLAGLLVSLRSRSAVERIEAQLIPFGHSLDSALERHRFQVHARKFMYLQLGKARGPQLPPPGIRLEPWNDRAFEACARLIALAYANHIDSRINEQYRNEEGAVKFLRNVVLLPGCGQFLPKASFVIPGGGAGKEKSQLRGVILTSVVAPRVAHTTQICLLPDLQGKGLGRALLDASIAALRARGFDALSLTVTSANDAAVRLYEHTGFITLREFSAAVWQSV